MWKRGISDEGINRLKRTVQAGSIEVCDIFWAEDADGVLYSVKPIYRGEALATLVKTNDYREDLGEKERIPIGDLFEFYTLMGRDRQIISTPEPELE